MKVLEKTFRIGVRRMGSLTLEFVLRSWLRRHNLPIEPEWLQSTRYDSKELRSALAGAMGDRRFREARRRLLIPAVDLTLGKPVVFKTPHLSGLVRDYEIRVADAILASTAAPTYFPHAQISSGSGYCDGGVWANNPGLPAYAEAVRIQRGGVDPVMSWTFEPSGIRLLSIGTGRRPFILKPPGLAAGLLWWAPRLFDLVSSSHSQGFHYLLGFLLQDRYRRVDFDIPEDTWRLDNTSVLKELRHMGMEVAAQEIRDLRPTFFTRVSEDCAWFLTPSQR